MIVVGAFLLGIVFALGLIIFTGLWQSSRQLPLNCEWICPFDKMALMATSEHELDALIGIHVRCLHTYSEADT